MMLCNSYCFHLYEKMCTDRMLCNNDNFLSHSENRVHVDEDAGRARMIIVDLEETDGGNYTCGVEAELVTPVKSIVYVVVLPREYQALIIVVYLAHHFLLCSQYVI